MDMDIDRDVRLVGSALKELFEACKKMLDAANCVPRPRARTFYLAPGVWWPACWDGETKWFVIESEKESWSMKGEGPSYCLYVAERFIREYCYQQPRLVLRLLRRIQAATAWCHARAEGRKRMVEEILRQQNRAVETLEAEAALAALKKNINGQ